MINPLVAKAAALYGQNLSVSAVGLRRVPDHPAAWIATFSINSFFPMDECGDNLPQHAIRFHRENLPHGIRASALARHPDVELLIRCSAEGAEALIRDLARVGRACDVASFGEGPTRRWLTKPNRWFRRG